jgi:hypothetical protein
VYDELCANRLYRISIVPNSLVAKQLIPLFFSLPEDYLTKYLGTQASEVNDCFPGASLCKRSTAFGRSGTYE